MESPPTFADVLAARTRIAPYLHRTALHSYPALDEVVGASTWVKHENHQPIGAFKVRGGVNLIACLTPAERERGVMSASTGNHGQSIAFACRQFGVRATIFAPDGANPTKVRSMQGLGARVVFHGADFDDAAEECERQSLEHGCRYVNSGNEPLLIAGVATQTLEIFEDRPDVDVLIVPVGGGSGAAGACLVARAVQPSARVIGVQSSAAPAAYRSWSEGRLIDDNCTTIAEGLATRTAFELPQAIMREHLDDFLLVDDDELLDAQRILLETTRNMVEAAGAASLAAALRLRDELAGQTVAIVMSGGNATPAQLREVLARG